MKLRKGKVRWFDELSGLGYIRDEETQESVFVHWSAIKGASTPANTKHYNVKMKKWATLKKNAAVLFEWCQDPYINQVSYVETVD